MSARSILYVEDNEANRMIVRDLLKLQIPARRGLRRRGGRGEGA